MFFKREKPRILSFDERISNLRHARFDTQPESGGGVRVTRGGIAAVVVEALNGDPRIDRAGVLIGKEVGVLVDKGYQKIWLTPGGVKDAARADQLKALHAFEEDLREALGLTSLYNESLGTTNEKHLYDRVLNRDRGVPRRPWER
jgi:hypothetical protein